MSQSATDSARGQGPSASPGPPRKIIECCSWASLLWWLVFIVGLLAAQAFAADYLVRVGIPTNERWSVLRYALVDSRAAMTALIGMFGLAIARQNLALGLRPYVSYSNVMPRREDASPRYVVLLRNEGTGPAIIAQLRYWLRFDGDDFESILEHETVVHRIKERCGLAEGNDYKLDRFSAGATVGKDKERVVFEVRNEAIDRLLSLRNFDISVRYRGMLGDLYEKTVECLRPDDYRRPHTLPSPH